MASVTFDDQSFSPAGVRRALTECAQGVPPTQNHDLIHDPRAWASGLVDHCRGTPLFKDCGEVLGQFLKGKEPAAFDLGLHLQSLYAPVQAEIVADVMFTLAADTTRDRDMSILAASFPLQVSERRFTYPPQVRAFTRFPATSAALAFVWLRFDLAWLKDKLPQLLPGDAAEAGAWLVGGLSGLSQAELEVMEQALADVLPRLSETQKRGLDLAFAGARRRAR